MLTTREILFGILLPLIASGLLGLIPWFLRATWLIPLTVGTAFLLGYANSLGTNGGFGLPRFPPSDGTDWLFWASIPAILLSMLTPILHRHWKAAPALWAGVVVWIVVHPLVPAAISPATQYTAAILAALIATLAVFCLMVLARSLGDFAVITVLTITLAGAGVLILSTNLRTTGVYGLGAAAAFAPAILFSLRRGPSPFILHPSSFILGLFPLAMSLLPGLLAAGHFYPDPGISLPQATTLLLAPLALLFSLLISPAHPRRRLALGLLLVTIVVIAIAAPAALKAMHEATSDRYGHALTLSKQIS